MAHACIPLRRDNASMTNAHMTNMHTRAKTYPAAGVERAKKDEEEKRAQHLVLATRAVYPRAHAFCVACGNEARRG